jgi:hypothetical protein
VIYVSGTRLLAALPIAFLSVAVGACGTTHVRTVTQTQTVTAPATTPGVPTTTEGTCEGGNPEGVGSSCHAEDVKFCSEHHCIGSFTTEAGTVAECEDGTYSHAGHIRGACSHHGGVRRD